MNDDASLPRPTEELIAFLRSLGTDEVDHTGHDFLTHLIAVGELLEAHGVDAEIAAAGLYHSIYGTEKFQEFSLPLSERAQVRSLIGERAERIVWLNCVMDRATFDAAVSAALRGESKLTISDRDGSAPVAVSEETLARVHLFDWLEQVERSEFGWGYRRSAYRGGVGWGGGVVCVWSRSPRGSGRSLAWELSGGGPVRP